VSFTATVRVARFAPASKTFSSKKDARAWAAATKALLIKQRRSVGAVRSDVSKLTVGDVLLEWLKDPRTLALKSYDSTHQMASWWIQHCGTTKVLDTNPLIWRAARDELRPGRAAATVNRYAIVMRAAWNWATDAGLVVDRPWPRRLMLTEPRGRTRFLDDAELARLLEAAGQHSQFMQTAITVSVATGMRRGELLRLNWSDIDYARQTVGIHITKTDTPRRVYLTQNACAALKALQTEKVRAIDGAVFTLPDGTRVKESTFDQRWHKVRAAAALKDFRYHDLRHSCASFLAQQGATLNQIAEVLGHKALATTQRYAHLVQGAPIPAHAALDAKLSKRP
jgi:integrase